MDASGVTIPMARGRAKSVFGRTVIHLTVILSGETSSRCEVVAQSKDPYLPSITALESERRDAA
jgi:hypothetical protein